MSNQTDSTKEISNKTKAIDSKANNLKSKAPISKIAESAWDKKFESEIIKEWKQKDSFRFQENSDKKVFVIDTPPPYVNAPIHIGHAATYTIQDFFARYHRMLGDNVIFPLGLDRNGLPIEVAAEKKFKVKLSLLPREQAVEYCKKILEETSFESIKTYDDLGISFSSWDFHTGKIGQAYMTDSDEYRSLTQDTFIEMWNKGLIYFDKRINNFSPGLGTTIADSEIEYKEIPSKFVHVKWIVKETQEEIIIATTRPELIASCGMVIYNPEDDRYKHLEGKHAILPLYNKEVLIKAHTDAKQDKGTGLVMMCSAGDNTDIRFFRDQGLTPIISIGLDGLMNENAGFLKGLPVKKAREQIIETLTNKGLIVEIKEIMHRTPVCERTQIPIEFVEMEELYLKQLDFVEDIRKISDKINFYDPKSKQILIDWLDSISIDWPISRRRFYGTEIPMWHCKNCSEIIVPKELGKYHTPWKEPCPIKECPKCKGTEFIGETRVLDTWFDSSISPLFNIGYLRNPKFYKKNPICTLRPQGKEIVRTWLYYTLLRCYLLTGNPIFEDIFIHYHIVDESGKKMSKSKGNGIDPKQIIEKLGADPFRLWCALEGNIHQTDLRCSFERIDSSKKTLTKLWNICRFISTFEYNDSEEYELMELDKFIISELNELITFSKEKYDAYDFHNPAKLIKNFIWETFSSHYLELVKPRAYNMNNAFSKSQQNASIFTLNHVIKSLLKLLSPITPFSTYKLYLSLYEKDLEEESFPNTIEISKDSAFTKEELTELNSYVWKFKKENGLSLKDELSSLSIPEKFEAISKDLISAHHLNELIFSNDMSAKK